MSNPKITRGGTLTYDVDTDRLHISGWAIDADGLDAIDAVYRSILDLLERKLQEHLENGTDAQDVGETCVFTNPEGRVIWPADPTKN